MGPTHIESERCGAERDRRRHVRHVQELSDNEVERGEQEERMLRRRMAGLRKKVMRQADRFSESGVETVMAGGYRKK